MSDIRSLIREILSEEIAAIRLELLSAANSREEQVRVDDTRSLTDFALSVLRRCTDPGFVSALQEGRLTFVPAASPAFAAAMPALSEAAYKSAFSTGPAAPVASQPVLQQTTVLVTTVPATVPEVTKNLISERDIAALGSETTRLRIGRHSKLTPLASDEARRRGIRIERSAT